MSDALKGITVFDERTCPWCGRRSHAGDCLLDDMKRYVEQLQRERDKLREAIREHRRNVWGGGKVKHEDDILLYSVLDGE